LATEGVESLYPAYSDKIRAAREQGFSDTEIQSVFQSRIQEQSRSGQSVRQIQSTLGQEQPGFLQRLASGPAGDLAQSSLEAAAYPVEVATGAIGGMIPPVARIGAAGLANLVAAATNSDPRALERKALSYVDKAEPYLAYQPQGKLARTTLEVAGAPFVAAEEGLKAAGVPEEIAKPAVEVGGLVLPYLYHRIVGRAPVDSPEARQRFLRQASEEAKRIEEIAPPDLPARIEAAKRDGFSEQEIAQALTERASKPVVKQEVSVEPSAKGPEFFSTLKDLGYTDEQLKTMPFAEKVRRARERVPAEEPPPIEQPAAPEPVAPEAARPPEATPTDLTPEAQPPETAAPVEPVNAPEVKSAPVETPTIAPESTLPPKVAAEAAPPIETPPAPKGEPAPVTSEATSIKNAVVDRELAAQGSPPAQHGQRMSFEEARAAAAKTIEGDPLAGKKLVDELAANPRPPTATEDALLLHEQTRLKNERVKAEDRLIEAQKSGNPEAITEAKGGVEQARTDFAAVGDVVTQVGTESSLSLGHRRMLMREDYSLAEMERQKQIANDGKPLTEAQAAEVKTLHEKISSTQKAFDEYIAKAESAKAEVESKLAHTRLMVEAAKGQAVEPHIKSLADRIVATMDTRADAARIRLKEKLGHLSAGVDPTLIADMAEIGAAKFAHGAVDFGRWSKLMIDDLGQKIEPYLKAVWDASQKAVDDFIEARVPKSQKEPIKRAIKGQDAAGQREAIKEQIRAKAESGDGDITNLAQRLARGFVQEGIKERGALIDAVHGELKSVLPETTRRETMDAISGYGKLRQLSKDEISVQLRDLKGQMQNVAKLEDMEANRPPLRTGVERRIPTTEERRLIKLVNEAKDQFQIPITDEATQLRSSLDMLKARMQNQIEDLQGRLERGDFGKNPRRLIQTDTEATRLSFDLAQTKARFNEGLFKDQLANRSLPQKILGGAGEAVQTSRSLLTSLDLSAVLRQGGFVGLGHPIRAAHAFPDMFRALLSKEGEHRVQQEIQRRPNYQLYKRAKLYLSEPRTTLAQMEEAYMSRWAEKIPGVGASQRAYTTFLNKLRADSFDTMANTLSRSGELTAVEAKAIANYINVATGRGDFGVSNSSALVGLNSIFFAPRFIASRFQLLTGQPLYRGSGRTRTLVAQEYARYLTGVATVYALGKLAGGDLETDSRSSDFGKLKFGNTRVDLLSGLAQVTTLLGREASGETKSISGKITPIRGDKVPYGGSNAADVIFRFLRTKLAPVPSQALDVLTGKNVVGQPVSPQSLATNVTVPLALRDIYDAMIDQEVPRGTALGILSIFGASLQTYDPQKKTGS